MINGCMIIDVARFKLTNLKVRFSIKPGCLLRALWSSSNVMEPLLSASASSSSVCVSSSSWSSPNWRALSPMQDFSTVRSSSKSMCPLPHENNVNWLICAWVQNFSITYHQCHTLERESGACRCLSHLSTEIDPLWAHANWYCYFCLCQKFERIVLQRMTITHRWYE